MSTQAKKKVGTINCAPTWRAVILIYAQAFAEGQTLDAREAAREELMRCAGIADSAIAAQRKAE